MKVKVGVSARHLHLSKKDFDILFGEGEFYSIKDLSQNGEFASNLCVSIKTEKGLIENVRVVGPLRDTTQVEVSKTDAYTLGINPPVRMSGDFDEASKVSLVSSKGEVSNVFCILANRHIHINTNDTFLKDGDIVSVRVDGKRGGVLDNVKVKAKDSYVFELHIDTDEANAFMINNGDYVDIIKGE